MRLSICFSLATVAAFRPYERLSALIKVCSVNIGFKSLFDLAELILKDVLLVKYDCGCGCFGRELKCVGVRQGSFLLVYTI